MTERYEVRRDLPAAAGDIFAVLCDPIGHVDIDASGMLQDATGTPVGAVGDTFVVHMDRESRGDVPLGKYDVVVTITEFETDHLITWEVSGVDTPSFGHYYGYRLEPTDDGTSVTSVYDWSGISDEMKETGIWPVISEDALRATLGILERTVRRRAG